MTEPQVQQTRKSRSFAHLFLAVLMLGTAIYIAVQLFVPSVEEDVVFTVQRGQNFKEVAEALEAQGAVPSASWLRFYARLTGKDYEIKAGSFLLKKGTVACTSFKQSDLRKAGSSKGHCTRRIYRKTGEG